jgi:hypothetical protein
VSGIPESENLGSGYRYCTSCGVFSDFSEGLAHLTAEMAATITAWYCGECCRSRRAEQHMAMRGRADRFGLRPGTVGSLLAGAIEAHRSETSP